MSNLEAVYEMTWAEFQIRLFAYKRKDKYDWIKLRELMWVSYIAPHQDPKKMVKRKEQFLKLEGDKKSIGGVSEEMKQIFIGEYKKWQETAQQQ